MLRTLSRNYLSKNVLGTQHFTKQKEVKGSHVCSAFHQQRRKKTQNIPSEVKSPYRHLDIPNVTITELLWEKMEMFPDHTAIECGVTGRKYTFVQLKKLSQRFAVSLLKSGLQPGQTVAIMMANCPEYPIVAYGCLEAGLVVTLVNHLYTADEVCYQLKDSFADCVVTSLEKLETASVAINKVKNSTKSTKDIKLLAMDLDRNDLSGIPPGVGRFSELIGVAVDTEDLYKLRNSVINTANTALLPYSSGTTGLPKGVQLCHKNLVSNSLQLGDVTPTIQATKDHQDVIPGILPFYHIYGFNGIMMTNFILGGKIVTLPKFEPNTFVNVLKNHKCSVLFLVPPLVQFLGSPEVTRNHVQYIRSTICGAAPIGASEYEKFSIKVPKENNPDFIQAYGLTETTTCLSYPIRNSNLATIGKPVSHTMMKIISIETGEILGPNQEGQICGKGPQVMIGYHNNPKATSATIDAEGWLHTGDIGYYDDEDNFYIVDRIKELIKVKGNQVAPAELEKILREVVGVKDAGVVGVPDERAGEVPIAYIVPSPGNPASVSDIREFVSEKVAPYKQLADIVFVDVIPKSASGKILRRVLKETYLSSKTK